jgi:hypothetical protein
MRKLTANLSLLVFALIFSFQLKAQDVASITGVITDQAGAVVPRVYVSLQNPLTGAAYATVSNAVGSYTLNQVKPGPGYEIKFTRDGFKPVIITGLYMNVDATRTQNARLSVGSTEQTVEVSAANQDVTLDTTDATIGNNFQVQYLNDLPIQNRDSPAALFTQQPGVTLDGAVTGARVDQTNVTLDGLDVNDEATGNFGVIVGNAPVDSVQEFRGVTAGPLSSAGQGGGGQFELVTRSGTNQFHGALAEYHRDTDTEANNWFNNNAGIPRPPLIRNQFGGNLGGPILSKKLFFFFDYNGRRDTLSDLVDRTVPMGTNTTGFRGGYISYKNSSKAIETLSPSQIQALDPLGIGFDSYLLSLFTTRYPMANDLTGDVGDNVNTAGYRFNAPFPYVENDFVQRVDYNLNSKMKLYGRGTFTRTTGTQSPVEFPGDPPTYPYIDQSYSWVMGHTWTISTTKVNQASLGETLENYSYPVTYNPQGITQYLFGGGLSGPYPSADNASYRTYPIPIVRDDFSWEKGRHSLMMGGEFKWETPNENTIVNYNFPAVGLGGYTVALSPSLRPSNIGSGRSTTIYDGAFAVALAPFTADNSNFNYNNKEVAMPQGSGLDQVYRYYETELYIGDRWKLTPELTISYGVRYQNYSVPYEIHGTEAQSNFTFDGYFGDRIAQSQVGESGNLVVPFVQYTLGGKANDAPGYFQPANRNFAPRLAFAYNPSFNRKSVFSGGAGIVYDHPIVNALQAQQLQTSYLFESGNIEDFGSSNPKDSLMTDERFSGIGNPPPPPAPPTVVTPYIPYVMGSGASAVPVGLDIGEWNIIIDPNLKTPYSIVYNFGFQHEFPQGYILKTSYVGRLGRRLLAQADASQLIDFPDSKSGQMMSAAMAGLTAQLRQGVLPQNVSAEPWFEDVVQPGVGVTNGFANNTQYIAAISPFPIRGDFADTIYVLALFGILPPNVGMASQFASNTFWTSKGFSSYNGLLTTLHKNAGHGLQFDINYTWSHSIDNVSFAARNNAGFTGFGFLCDVLRPRECRGKSDFDVANYLNGDFIYDLPFGRGRSFAATVPLWANEVIGGWSVSGLPTWHTGKAYNAFSTAYVASFANDAPATLIGPISLLRANVHGGNGASVNIYSNQASALDAFTGPLGFNIGSRNNLRGPGYFNLDLGVGKTFPVYKDKVNLKFRADAFNSTNHPSFGLPDTDITESNGVPFGTINSTASTARVLQGALRLEF